MATAEQSGNERRIWRLSWRTVRGPVVRSDLELLEACAQLYSSSYGVWGPYGSRPGERIRRRSEDIAELLASEDSFLAVAQLPGGGVAGYCVAVLADVAPDRRIAWVSQLVVGEPYRNTGVATNLLFSIWQFSDRYAWGLVTANPYAVRALESATRRPCRLSEIRRRGGEILDALSEKVPYLPLELQTARGQVKPVVDTQFHVSHDALAEMRSNAARGDRPWALGDIKEGEEWFACTFSSQPPSPLSPEKLEAILVGADRVWIDAFARMTLTHEHQWHRHTNHEIGYLLSNVEVPNGARILDVGCGDGRHANALAERGFRVQAIDVVPALIDRAHQQTDQGPAPVFAVADARDPLPNGKFDLALLLYDVLGASANRADDLLVLRNVAARLGADGRLALSVMNSGPVAGRMPSAHLPDDNATFLRALEQLPPSNTMESTGDIFNPELLLYYNGVYYRKEQFLELEDYLPSEHVVRDLRYSPDSLRELLDEAGFELLELRPVQAGHWDREPQLGSEDERAKELLAIAMAKGPSSAG